jgi:hypothetical protein
MLKLLVGGQRADQMLELRRDAWDFVHDEAVIDLKDRSRVFRIGRELILQLKRDGAGGSVRPRSLIQAGTGVGGTAALNIPSDCAIGSRFSS